MFMQTVDDNLWIFHMTIKKQIIIIWNNEQTPLFIDILSLTGQFRRNEMFIESKLRNKVKSRQGRNVKKRAGFSHYFMCFLFW